jgi:hypothetical protein
MRLTILENKPDKLVLRTGPWWSWWTLFTRILAIAMLLVGVLLLVGVVVDPEGGPFIERLPLPIIWFALTACVAWWGQVTTCTFDRLARTYTFERNLMIKLRRSGPLSSIAQVVVELVRHRRSDPRYYVRVTFVGGRRYTIDNATDEGAAVALQGRIQRFLDRGSEPKSDEELLDELAARPG